jgi:hypothetical protein
MMPNSKSFEKLKEPCSSKLQTTAFSISNRGLVDKSLIKNNQVGVLNTTRTNSDFLVGEREDLLNREMKMGLFPRRKVTGSDGGVSPWTWDRAE